MSASTRPPRSAIRSSVWSSSKRRMWTVHSTASPSPPSASRPALRTIGHDAKVDAGRVVAVDRDLRLAGRTALLKGGKVHEGEADRALHLVDVVACEEDDRARGVDALNRPLEAVRGGAAKEAQRFGLRFVEVAQTCPPDGNGAKGRISPSQVFGKPCRLRANRLMGVSRP